MGIDFKDADPQLKDRSAKALFCNLLNLTDLPKIPEELPSDIYMPSAWLGGIEKAILDTNVDSLERSQSTYVNKRNGSLRFSKLFVGDDDSMTRTP